MTEDRRTLLKPAARAIALVTFVLATLGIGFCVAIERTAFMAIDRCLDAGGRWNEELGKCDGVRTTR